MLLTPKIFRFYFSFSFFQKLNDLQIMKTKHTLMSKKILKKAIWFLSISRNAVCVLISCFVAYAYTTTGEPPFKLSGKFFIRF